MKGTLAHRESLQPNWKTEEMSLIRQVGKRSGVVEGREREISPVTSEIGWCTRVAACVWIYMHVLEAPSGRRELPFHQSLESESSETRTSS